MEGKKYNYMNAQPSFVEIPPAVHACGKNKNPYQVYTQLLDFLSDLDHYTEVKNKDIAVSVEGKKYNYMIRSNPMYVHIYGEMW